MADCYYLIFQHRDTENTKFHREYFCVNMKLITHKKEAPLCPPSMGRIEMPPVIAGLTRNPLIAIALLFAVQCWFSCNSTPNPAEVKTATTVQPADSLIEPTGNAQLDSLLRLAAVAKQDTNLILVYKQIADFYEYNDFIKAEEYFFKVRQLSEQLDWDRGRQWFFTSIPSLYLRMNLWDSAIVVSHRALEWVKDVNNEAWKSNVNVNTGVVYAFKEWYETALQYFMEALQISERLNDKKKLAHIYNQMSMVYRDMNATEKAIEFSEKAYALNPEDPFTLPRLADSYMSNHQYEKSITCLEDALRIFEQQNNVYMLGTIYIRLSANYLSLFDLEKAEKYIYQALKIEKEINNDYGYSAALSQLAALEKLKGNFGEAEKHIKETLKITLYLNQLEGQKTCYTMLSELALAQKEFRPHIL